jgi:selenocysteine lyase/cysteine desulfurase
MSDPVRDLFDIPTSVTYLNCASLAPRLHAVTDAGRAALERTAKPWTIRGDDWFDGSHALRRTFASLSGVPVSTVALVPSVSYGIAVAARNVPVGDGDNIVVLEREYPSNYYSWARLARERGASIRVASDVAGTGLTEAVVAAIDGDTAVVAVPPCRWTDGAIVDLVRVGEAARKHGAALVVDASQSLGVLPLDIAAIRPDFLVAVGYKWMLGPYGLAYMYVDERWHGSGVPLEESWLHRRGSENFASLVDYTDAYKSGAERFEYGESSQFLLGPMAIAALTQVVAWGPAFIQARLREWMDELASRAGAAGFTFLDADRRVGHLLGLGREGGLPDDLPARLAERDIHVAARGNDIRVSPHLHNSADDLVRLVDALEDIVGG